MVTENGFGDTHVLNFEAFANFNGTLYVAASRAANTVGGGLGGVTILRLASGPLDDYDLDGILNNIDNCPLVANLGQADGDSDEVGDLCDNCPTNYNPNQEDFDNDSIGYIADDCIDSDLDDYGDYTFYTGDSDPSSITRSPMRTNRSSPTTATGILLTNGSST